MRGLRGAAVALAAASLLCAAAVSAAEPETIADADGIQRAIQDYDEAWNRKDAAGFEKRLAPDYVYFTSKGAVWSKPRWLALMLSPKYTLASARRSDIAVHRTGDTAVASSRWQGHGRYDGKPFRDDQRCSLVLRREAADWRILAEHCTQIVP
jgi:ketosteroid isomerase-like protein